MRLLAALCVFLFTLTILGPASVHAQVPTQLQTLSENLDGVVEDLAGPRTFVDPAISRIWVAKGRVRASLRMSDRVRVHAEDKTFSSGAASAGNPETVVALEFNDANGRLYTLTQAGIYREETAVGGYGQPNPGGMSFLDFSNGTTPMGEHLEPGETFQDVKVWPDGTRVFLLTSHRIIALTDILTLGLAAPGTWSKDMFPPNGSFPWITDTTGDAAFNSLKVHKFLRFRLCLETDESPALKDHLIAVVLAETSGYGPAVQRPVPNVVLLCDLGAAAAYEPRFDSDPDAGDVHYAYFHVAPSYPGGASFKSEWFNVYGIDTFQDSNDRCRAYLACGNKRHVQEALIASALPRHDTQVGSLPTQFKHVLPELDHENPEQALNVLADDLAPSTRFFVVSQNGFHTHLVQSPGDVFVTDDEPFGKGCSHDMLRTTFVSLPSEIAEPDIVVTATTGVSDYKIKAMNVTEDLTSGIPLASVGGRAYAPFTVDGGVVLPHAYAQAPAQRDDVYIATWGGVAKYNPTTTGAYVSDPAAYQPALAAGEPRISTRVTEAIVAGGIGPPISNRDVILTASARGDFMDYRTEGAAGFKPKEPLPFAPVPPLLPAGWNYTTDTFYANDVAFLDLQPGLADSGKFALADLSRQLPTTSMRKIVLLAYEWRPLTTEWRHFQTSTESADVLIVEGTLSTNITIAPNKSWFVVAHDRGFFTVSHDLLGSGSMTIVSEVNPNFGTTASPASISGLAASDTRIFAYLNPVTGGAVNEIRVYEVNPSTGAVTATGYKTIPNSAYLIPPGVAVDRAWRGRIDLASSTAGSVYFACTDYVLEFLWTQGASGPASDSLTLSQWWQSGYSGHFLDCVPFTPTASAVPRALLLIKERETFAISTTQ